MKQKKYAVILGIIFFLVFSVIVFKVKGTYYLNLSPSEPPGIYRLTHSNGRLNKGTMVIMSVPDTVGSLVYVRGWLSKGDQLLKTVGAIPGDIVTVTDSEININGRYVGPVSSYDEKGSPLPKLRGKFKIQPGFFLPIATRVPNSFDGRYFGPVAINKILGKAIPVLLFN